MRQWGNHKDNFKCLYFKLSKSSVCCIVIQLRIPAAKPPQNLQKKVKGSDPPCVIFKLNNSINDLHLHFAELLE